MTPEAQVIDRGSTTKICLECGNSFVAHNNRVRKGAAKYCGKSCAAKALEHKALILCVVCEKPFYAKPAQAHLRQTCSRGCAAILLAGRRGHDSPAWRGGKVNRRGYIKVYMPDHPRADKNYIWEHVLVAEKALGKYLPEGALVHHVNKDKADNRPCNLVICENRAYHTVIHARQRRIQCQN